MVEAAGRQRILAARPKRIGRVFAAGLLFGLDIVGLLIWAMWFVAFLRGSSGLMTINDVVVPLTYALLLGPLAMASMLAVVLISQLRGYPIVLGIAIAWLAFALTGFGSGAFAVGSLVISRAAIVALLASGRAAFRPSESLPHAGPSAA